MNIQQLRSVCVVAQRGSNITEAATALHTSQSAVSKQIQQLERELNVEIFIRSGKKLIGPTAFGKSIIKLAQNISDEIAQLRAVCRDHTAQRDTIVIATSHTQARYFLPTIIKQFSDKYPAVDITLRHGVPREVSDWVASGEATVAVTTETDQQDTKLVSFPCQKFRRVLIVPKRHPLLRVKQMTLQAIEPYALIMYESAFAIRHKILRTFHDAGLNPKYALSAIDADVIKSCVEHGLGVAVLSEAVFDAKRDKNLRAIPVDHLFEASTTQLLVRRDRPLSRHHMDFIKVCVPRLSAIDIRRVFLEGTI